MYQAYLYQIFTFGGPVEAHKRSSIFPIAQWTLLCQTILGQIGEICVPHFHSSHLHSQMDWGIATPILEG